MKLFQKNQYFSFLFNQLLFFQNIYQECTWNGFETATFPLNCEACIAWEGNNCHYLLVYLICPFLHFFGKVDIPTLLTRTGKKK